MTAIAATTVTTPLGPFTMIVRGDAVVAAGFAGSAGELRRQLHHPADAPEGGETRGSGGFV